MATTIDYRGTQYVIEEGEFWGGTATRRRLLETWRDEITAMWWDLPYEYEVDPDRYIAERLVAEHVGVRIIESRPPEVAPREERVTQ